MLKRHESPLVIDAAQMVIALRLVPDIFWIIKSEVDISPVLSVAHVCRRKQHVLKT